MHPEGLSSSSGSYVTDKEIKAQRAKDAHPSPQN